MPNRSVVTGLLVALMLFVAGAAFAGDGVPRMEPDELLAQIDSPDVVIIDVRRSGDWENSMFMIKNAVRMEYDDVDSWAGDLPMGKIIVLYCA